MDRGTDCRWWSHQRSSYWQAVAIRPLWQRANFNSRWGLGEQGTPDNTPHFQGFFFFFFQFFGFQSFANFSKKKKQFLSNLHLKTKISKIF
jgi:hypothetical protein